MYTKAQSLAENFDQKFATSSTTHSSFAEEIRCRSANLAEQNVGLKVRLWFFARKTSMEYQNAHMIYAFISKLVLSGSMGAWCTIVVFS